MAKDNLFIVVHIGNTRYDIAGGTAEYFKEHPGHIDVLSKALEKLITKFADGELK